jgi:hypothetical protein
LGATRFCSLTHVTMSGFASTTTGCRCLGLKRLTRQGRGQGPETPPLVEVGGPRLILGAVQRGGKRAGLRFARKRW